MMRTHLINSLFSAGLLASIAYGVYLFRKMAHLPILDRLAVACVPCAFYTVVGIIGQNFLEAAWQPWNNTRLLPSFLLADHLPLYYPKNSGPVLDMMYGPMNAVAYWPVTLFSRAPEYVSVIAKGFTLVYFFAPVIWLILIPHSDRHTGILWASTALVGFWFYSLESHVLGNVALSNHADAPALGLGMLGCILYLEGERRQSVWLLLGSALSLNLSLWTKQVTVPLVLAVPLYAFLANGWRSGLRMTIFVLGTGILLAAGIFYQWGYSTVVFNLITNPSHQPWEEQLIKANGHAIMELWNECRWMLLGFGTYLVYEFVYARVPTVTRRDWFRSNRWSLFAIAALLLVPSSLIGRFKIGGGLNALCFTVYFMAVAVMMVTIKVVTHPVYDTQRKLIQDMLKIGVCFYAASSTLLHLPMVSYYYLHLEKELSDWQSTPARTAYNFVRAHPDEAYLPWGIFSTYLATGKLYHFDYAIYDRDIAGFPITPEHLHAYLPAHMRMIIFSPHAQDQYVMRYFPEYTRLIEVPELPDWKVYTKP